MCESLKRVQRFSALLESDRVVANCNDSAEFAAASVLAMLSPRSPYAASEIFSVEGVALGHVARFVAQAKPLRALLAGAMGE